MKVKYARLSRSKGRATWPVIVGKQSTMTGGVARPYNTPRFYIPVAL